MSCIVMSIGQEGYQEFLMPEIDNADYEICLERRIFGLRRDLEMKLEIVDGIWRFLDDGEVTLTRTDDSTGYRVPLRDGLVLRLGYGGVQIILVILESTMSFPVFQKRDIRRVNQVTVGSEAGSHIRYMFREYISGNHAVLFRQGNDWMLQDNSRNGTYRNGSRVNGCVALTFGDQITLFGLRMIYLGSCLAVCALSGNVEIADEWLPVYNLRAGLVLPEQESLPAEPNFKRSPRTLEKLYTDTIEIEPPPQLSKTKKRPLLLTIGPSFTMAIPMLLGCLMAIMSSRASGSTGGVYMFTGIVTAFSSAVLGVFWALTNMRYAAHEEEDNEELRYNMYGQYLIDITEFIKQKWDENRETMFRNRLSGQDCCAFGASDSRLWNHNNRQDDFLTVRLGTGTIPFQADIHVPKEKFTLVRDDLAAKPGMIRDTYQLLRSVPFSLELRSKGIVGVIGGAGKKGCYQIIQNISAQLAANYCYTEVKMVYIYDETKSPEGVWDFAKWLPHVWMDDRRTRLIAGNKSELGDVCYELSKLIQQRVERPEENANGEQNEKGAMPLPHYIIFVDSMELLEGELLERIICHPRPEYGITSFLLTERYEDLPNTCENIIRNDGTVQYYHIYNEEQASCELVLDQIDPNALMGLARRLCGIRVSDEETGGGEIPSRLDFLTMFGVHNLGELNVIERWKKNRIYETIRVPIGQKAGGAPCYLDVHEKYHGPHGLVAGTTGSGKSETLQTWILSLAINFSPDDAAFFIIDFKGAGMANLFTDLPHMAGTISNLSGNQISRAMISIESENKRRQRVFAEHGVNNINLYTRLYKSHEAEIPVPHLFIIIDEFAELKREEPEFMKQLISVAQVGRSLGVHLILATQKPSGTVDDNIWSNSRFRLCLRVQDRQDSNDMLHKPDAAYITQAGRGYLQVGSDEIYEQFQSGFSGAEYHENVDTSGNLAVMLTRTGREVRGNKVHRKAAGDGPVKPKTQLDAVIEYLGKVADANHCRQKMLLWLPVLPAQLYFADLPGQLAVYADGVWPEREEKWTLETNIGLYDDPAGQVQRELTVSFSAGGHLAVCGMVATGKSTFLQTLLYGLILRYRPDELNFYVVDYSSRVLLPFEQAPHCGGVVIDTDTDKVKKLFHMLDGILDQRKSLFGGGNYSQYVQAHGKENTPPAVLVVIDNCAGFREKTGGAFDAQLLRISREGVGYGVFLVLTSAGFGSSEIPSKIGDNIRTILSLEMSDKYKYAEILHTPRISIMPEKDVKGRGLAHVGEQILEFQTALAFEAADAYELSTRLEALGAEMSEHWDGPKARRIPMIPEKPNLVDFAALEDYRALNEQKRYLPLGYQAQDASVYAIDLWRTYCYLISGRSRTGKKNVLKLLLAAAAHKADAEVVLIDLAGANLSNAVGELPVKVITTDSEVYHFFKSTQEPFKERNRRKQGFLAEGLEDDEIAERNNEGKQYFIFIANLSAFIKTATKTIEGLGSIQGYVENITEKGSRHGFYFFACVNPDEHSLLSGQKLYKNMLSYGTGIHLGGNAGTQRLFQFTGLSLQEQNRPAKPGIGLIPSEEPGAPVQTVVLPLVKGTLT